MKAAFLGRFQPLHLGHSQVIEGYIEEYDGLEVVIGSAGESRTGENPLTAEERRGLIEDCFPDVEIVELEDRERTEEGNREWVQKLGEKVDADVLITQNDLVKELARDHTELEVEEQELYDEELYSGTEIRRRIRSGEEWRYLVPDCAREKLSDLTDEIKESGQQYEFEPGWKRENAYHGTAEK